jgi:hypothetical protein
MKSAKLKGHYTFTPGPNHQQGMGSVNGYRQQMATVNKVIVFVRQTFGFMRQANGAETIPGLPLRSNHQQWVDKSTVSG